ncbi:hypothetical protein PAXRUDRAFT_129795 [Paxillus rubicundulus Ve08.2h10]|uniref:Uncharacterized protein n=1 Tax=Paxillus rubicundulus Ve08.2h10 TaxID=930991 RepID=A0A0D0E6B5_9AGAM|nr:hypothetical protein PAXRUDRAFT_129795 [Paxillus rubicundulus Ve08.2h10]
MQVILFTIFIWALGAVHALPWKRASADLGVLMFASVLEQLESNFYSQTLQTLNASSFEAAGFVSSEAIIQQIQAIATDESTHAEILTVQSIINTFGSEVVSGCTFNFSSVLTDVETMVATARVVENVGVSAYLGALTAISDPSLVTAAGSIMTVEARHQTVLNLLSDATSIPQPFDMALTPADVLALAGPFISGCDLGVSANPPLTVTSGGSLVPGTKLYFSSPALNGTIPENQLSCQIVAGGVNSSVFQPICDCAVPANISGPMYVFVTADQTTPEKRYMHTTMKERSYMSNVVAGPALLFIDNEPDLIGNLIRPGLNDTNGNGTLATAEPATASMSFAPPTTVTLVTGKSIPRSMTPSTMYYYSTVTVIKRRKRNVIHAFFRRSDLCCHDPRSYFDGCLHNYDFSSTSQCYSG